MDDSYSLRPATAADAAAIARQRGLMFLDMKLASTDDAGRIAVAAETWFATILERNQYKGWLVEVEGKTVAGGGLHLSEIGPLPGLFRAGRSAHIANVYTDVEHRKRGIARLLLNTMLDWCVQSQIDQVTLTASNDGRVLYSSLGFVSQPDGMLLKLDR